jgi:hypothetical protein
MHRVGVTQRLVMLSQLVRKVTSGHYMQPGEQNDDMMSSFMNFNAHWIFLGLSNNKRGDEHSM